MQKPSAYRAAVGCPSILGSWLPLTVKHRDFAIELDR